MLFRSNLVQRDVNTCLPTIHSSSLKGALKVHFSSVPVDSKFIENVFGMEDNKPGKWKFLSADLLSRPIRSDKIQYFNATSSEALKNFLVKAEALGVENEILIEIEKITKLTVPKNKPFVFVPEYDGAIIEDLEWVAGYKNVEIDFSKVSPLLGENIVLIEDADFRELELPVIARNHLENGQSENLWYEEVVPYDSRFGFFIIEKDSSNSVVFIKGIENVVQIGANASIGYGLCQIKNQF